MIGANASGKSNALEAFRFLSWLSQGQKLSVLKHRVDDSEQIIRGQVKDLGFRQTTRFTLGCTLENTKWSDFLVELTFRDDELHISHETITSPQERSPLYRIEQSSAGLASDVRVAYNNFKKGPHKPRVTCTDQIAIMNQLASSAMFDQNHKQASREIPTTTTQYQDILANTLFLDPVPSKMRGDSHSEKELRGDCSNLSGVI